ncbi:MAG: STAS domain-containing protein [bacterium]|nr:STAS domain-containing protein [bacterium]
MAGRVDAVSAQPLKEALKQLVSSERNRFVIDLAEVSFVDSSGLIVLISLFKLVREHNGTMALASPGTQIRVALAQTCLDQLFPIYADTAAALDAFK